MPFALSSNYCVHCNGSLDGRYKQLCMGCHNVGLTENILRTTFQNETLYCNHCGNTIDTPRSFNVRQQFLCASCKFDLQPKETPLLIPEIIPLMNMPEPPLEQEQTVLTTIEETPLEPPLVAHQALCRKAPHPVVRALLRLRSKMSLTS